MSKLGRFIIAFLVVALAIPTWLFVRENTSWFTLNKPESVLETDIFIYGSSLGGTSAAIVAAEHGAKVVLATEGTTVGGQAVDSGLSAFDDNRIDWEEWGLYADLLKFLGAKRGSAKHGGQGLGEAVVGRAASIPSDIEEFFRSRLKHENMTLLTEQNIVRVEKSWGEWNEALIENRTSKTRTLVRFRYLVDSTVTGRVLALTHTPFNLGFDSRSKTGEISALPDDMLQMIIKGGKTPAGTLLGTFGNRTQAVSSPFALLDKGYPGDFFPPTDKGKRCWKSTQTGSFISGAYVLTPALSSCPLEISVTTESTDIFDVYLVHHGGSARVLSASPLWQDIALFYEFSLDAEKTFSRIGAFPFEAGRTTTFSVMSDISNPAEIEGMILVKRNILHEQVLVLRAPFASAPIQWKRFPSYAAELTLLFKTPLPSDLPAFDWNGTSYEMEKLNGFSARVNIPWIPNGMNLPSKALNSQNLSAIIITPVTITPSSITFNSTKFEREFAPGALETSSAFSGTKQPIREWSFVASQQSLHFFSLAGSSQRWWTAELLDGISGLQLKTITFKANVDGRLLQPFLFAELEQGRRYKLRFAPSNEQEWENITLFVSALGTSPLYFSAYPDQFSSAPAGVYDLWVRSAKARGVPFSFELPSAQQPLSMVTYNPGIFEYFGKAFLVPGVSPKFADPDSQILAVPSQSVDVFARAIPPSASEISMLMRSIPPGLYRAALVSSGSSLPSSMNIGTKDGITTKAQFSPINSSAVITERTIPKKNLHTLQFLFPANPGTMNTTLYLFEDIPSLTESWSFGISPSFTGNADAIPTPLFPFRNIVSPSNLLKGEPVGLIPPFVATNTMGMTLVISPSNDLKTVYVEEIDSESIRQQSRDLSAAYAYWMRYDAPQTQSNLGCDPVELPCTSKRAQLVIGLFTDSNSPFAEKPYIREGRRLDAKRVITQEDLRAASAECPDKVCPAGCSPISRNPNWCVMDIQTPLLYEDALTAVSYPLDLRGFYSRREAYLFMQSVLKEYATQLGTYPNILELNYIFHVSKPSEVSLGMLLPRNGSNIFPASLNMGVTQIANGMYRVHINELSVGQAVGRMLSYCLKESINPHNLGGESLRKLQIDWIREGGVIYPIANLEKNILSRIGTQYLIVTGLLLPSVTLNPKTHESIFYTIPMDTPLTADDAPVVAQVLGRSHSGALLYNDLLPVMFGEHLSPKELVKKAQAAILLGEKTWSIPDNELMKIPVIKGDLYRAIGLFVQNNKLH